MDNQDQNQSNISNDELKIAFEGEKMNKKQNKKNLIFLVIGIIGIIGGVAMIVVNFLIFNKPKEAIDFNKKENENKDAIYSDLTGEKLADASLKTAPTYCIQTPNGTDGARPQAGLNQAGVIFEAIAEAGITRFAAIYQNPTSAVIGPIRSLRIYYLQWDTPFDCAIVHAGGADDALVAVASGGYKDLSEDYQYMYRGTYGGRLWNNLFTTADYLKQSSSDAGYASSNVKGFTRMTPEEANKNRADNLAINKLDITSPTSENTSDINAKVVAANLNLGGWGSFNVRYDYNVETNTYARSYENGDAHEVYSCPSEDLGEKNPEDVCELTQMTPTVVIAMMVNESKASDNYHEDITAVGSGKAYIFQNGMAIEGTWNKTSVDEQIKFLDDNDEEIKLVPGQAFVTAVPNYGSVEF